MGGRKKIDVYKLVVEAIMIFFALICIMPFWYVIVTSISDPGLVKEGLFRILPTGFSLKVYHVVFRDQKFFNGLSITLLRTIVGTAIALAIQCAMAYALSKPYLRGRKSLRFILVFCVLFNGGIIPTYLVVQSLGLINTVWALILPIAFSPWNTLIMISFFSSLPPSLDEAARLDGANDLRIFSQIAVPLSLPSIATISLFIAVRHWNELMDGVIYINSNRLKPIQVYLIELVMQSQTQSMVEPSEQYLTSISLYAAVIFASCLPILLLYPFLQRFFVSGIMLGGIKG